MLTGRLFFSWLRAILDAHRKFAEVAEPRTKARLRLAKVRGRLAYLPRTAGGRVAELAYAHGLGPCGATHESSSLSPPTTCAGLASFRSWFPQGIEGSTPSLGTSPRRPTLFGWRGLIRWGSNRKGFGETRCFPTSAEEE